MLKLKAKANVLSRQQRGVLEEMCLGAGVATFYRAIPKAFSNSLFSVPYATLHAHSF